MRALVTPAAALVLTACLRVPPEPAHDAGTPTDAGPGPDFCLERVVVRDLRGRELPAGEAPRRPVVELHFSEPPAVEPEEEPAVWLLAGAPDESLSSDLEASPLRIATRGRTVPATIERAGARWTLTASERLPRQFELSLAVGAWMTSEVTEERLGAPFVLAIVTSDAPEAGAEVTASWPPDGAASVSPSLVELAVRFDGPVELPEGALGLFEGERIEGARTATVPCPEVGWDDGWCARLTPERPLRRSSAHRLVLDERALDSEGAPVGPWEARFTTALQDDGIGPELRPIACAIDEESHEDLCVLASDERIVVRLAAAEPTRMELELGGRTVRSVAPRGDAVLAVEGLSHDRGYPCHLSVRDTAERALEMTPTLFTTPPLAPVSIVEVRADPRGPEPTQEYVEVLNSGTVPIDLDGFSLSDRPDAEGDRLGRGTLAPGERALIVADAFDPDEGSDPRVPPGVALYRVDRSLGSGGLSNAGEPLFLRDALGHRLSTAPAMSAGGAGRCIVREAGGARTVEGFVAAPCTPGLP